MFMFIAEDLIAAQMKGLEKENKRLKKRIRELEKKVKFYKDKSSKV